MNLDEIQKSKNVVDLLDESQRLKIAENVINGCKCDEHSRKEWKETIDKAMEIAKQSMDVKNFPWPKASNIKYPLICKAAIDFASRVLPEIIPNDRIVKVATVGADPQGSKFQRSLRVENYMSYQLLKDPDWYDSVDSLLHILPVVGTVFKKTYYSKVERRNISEVCSPLDIVVNHATKSVEKARRITHRIKLSLNDIISRQRRGFYNSDIDAEMLRPDDCDPMDEDFEVEVLEQHCWYDFDEDGYREPYIVFVHERTRQVFRIEHRIKKVERNKDGEVVQITAWNCFTDYHFIRSPDGGFYSMGFGQLLLPINKAINSLINQLIDAGTLSVTQGGFLGKGLRIRDAEYKFRPFEWKMLDTAAGTDIAKNVFPFPVREPSDTLFKLLTLMMQVGDDLSNSTEALQGTSPGQNVSKSVQDSLIEQGSKMFVAINRRFYRSQAKEYNKLYELNYYYLTDKEYTNVLDEQASVKADFDLESNDIFPAADPTLSSMQQKLSKAQVLMSLRTADPRAVDEYILQTMQFDKDQAAAILPQPDPNAPPSPEVQEIMSVISMNQAKAQKAGIETQLLVNQMPLDQQQAMATIKEAESRIQESVARVWKMQKDAAHGDQKILIAGGKMQMQETLKQGMAEHAKFIDGVDASLEAKKLDLKEQEIAAGTILEAKKIDVMATKATKPNA